MTAPARKADESVAERRERTAALVKAAPAGQLPEPVKQEIEKVKMMHKVAREIANLSWGRDLNQNAALAIAMWADRNSIDITEFDVLGGRLYKNAQFYLNRAAPLIRSGVIAYLRADHIHADPRLVELSKASDPGTASHAAAEIGRRALERVAYNVPENATAAVIARCGVRTPGGITEYTGCKFIEKGRKRTIKKRDGGSFTVDADPVGDERPVETCETRAYRRVLRMVAPTIPALATSIAVAEDDGVGVEEIVQEERAKEREAGAELRQLARTQGDPSWVENGYDGQPMEMGRIAPKGETGDAYAEGGTELPLDDRRGTD